MDNVKIEHFNAASHNDIEQSVRGAANALGLTDARREIGPAYRSDVLRISVQGPHCRDFKIVDVPGIIHVITGHDHPVHGISRKYMDDPRSIILAVVNARYDASVQQVLWLVKEADPYGKRSIFILTKPDMPHMPNMKELNLVRDWINTVQGFGDFNGWSQRWHVLLNRNYLENIDNTPSQDRDRKEEDFFKEESNPWHSLYQTDKWGVVHLRKHLHNLLLQYDEDANSHQGVRQPDAVPRARQALDGNSVVEFTNSEISSVFSDEPSISSASSAAVSDVDRNFAFEIAKALLENDEMKETIAAFLEIGLPTGQEKAQRRLLKSVREYAKELQKTAQNPFEIVVANFVRGRYLVIARTMERFGKGNDEGSATVSFTMDELDNLIEVRVTGLEKIPDYLRDLPSDVGARIGTVEERDEKQDENVPTHADEPIDSDSSSVDEQPEVPEKTQERLPHIAMAKDFLLGGAPFAKLLSMIQELVEKPKETKKSTKISEVGHASYP